MPWASCKPEEPTGDKSAVHHVNVDPLCSGVDHSRHLQHISDVIEALVKASLKHSITDSFAALMLGRAVPF